MAYQTGTATNVNDLLDILRVFALAQGWTVNLWTTHDGTWQRLHLQIGTSYINVASYQWTDYGRNHTTTLSAEPGIAVVGSTGFSAGSAWDAQPGTFAYPALSNDMGVSAGMTYWLFAGTGPDWIACVAEVAPGIYKHVYFGDLDKLCTFTGGSFAGAQYHYNYYITINDEAHPYHDFLADCATLRDAVGGLSHLRADLDGDASYWYPFRYSGARLGRSPVRNDVSILDLVRWPAALSPAALNGQTFLWPLWIWVLRSTGYWAMLGSLPGIRMVRMATQQPQQILTLGSDDWMVFPAIQRNGAAGSPNSGLRGYAYRKA